MKILILGGHGFVGRHMQQVLKSTSHDVTCVSRADGVDLRDYAQTLACFQSQNPDAILNFAAHVGSVHYVSSRAADVLADNLRMTLNIYQAVQSACPKARIINPLSNCSYPGDADIHLEDDWWAGQVHESVYAYGNYKRFVYVTARCFSKQFGVDSVNLLVPNTFGPGDSPDPNKTHALNGMIIRMIQSRNAGKDEFEIWGTGKPVREWAYVGDVVALLGLALNRESPLVEPVNIAQNRGYSIRESAEMIAEEIGFTGRLVFNTQYQDGALRKVLDDRRFRSMFPDFQFTDHREGIRKTVAYYETVL